jgi:hypothetical protein
MTDIFIAAAPEDRPRVAPLAEALRAAGLNPVTEGGVEQVAQMPLTLVTWSERSVDPAQDGGLLDLADKAKAKGSYAGVKIDDAPLPFGFGGLQLFDLSGWNGSPADPRVAEMVAALQSRLSGKSTGFVELERLPDAPSPKRNLAPIIGIAAALVIAIGIAAFFFMRSGEPTTQDRIAAQFATMPCAWLGIDPVQNGEDGTLALTGIAGDPAKAGASVRAFAKAENLPIETVTIDKVAQIDPRECAAIDGPIKLRKDLGGRLRVTGEPFILNTKVTPHQALVRVQIALRDQDKSMALLGVEPSGKVTWSIPDIAAMGELKNYDVGLVETGKNAWEFTIYPDHLGWTGLLLVAGDSPLAQQLDQGAVQNAGDFARTLAAATARGQWDAEMVWFRIDPDPAR